MRLKKNKKERRLKNKIIKGETKKMNVETKKKRAGLKKKECKKERGTKCLIKKQECERRLLNI